MQPTPNTRQTHQLDRTLPFGSLRYHKKKTKKEIESITTITDHKTHQVQKGDTLYSISKKYKVELQLLVQENKIENNTIFLGQNLIIP